RRDRLQVAHLAHEDDIRVFAEHRAQGGLEAAGVRAQLALIDHRLAVGVDVLDRVLDRHDVAVTLLVDDIEHRSQGRRLPDTSGANSSLTRWPSTRMTGGRPSERWRSDAFRSAASRSRSSMWRPKTVGPSPGARFTNAAGSAPNAPSDASRAASDSASGSSSAGRLGGSIGTLQSDASLSPPGSWSASFSTGGSPARRMAVDAGLAFTNAGGDW